MTLAGAEVATIGWTIDVSDTPGCLAMGGGHVAIAGVEGSIHLVSHLGRRSVNLDRCRGADRGNRRSDACGHPPDRGPGRLDGPVRGLALVNPR